MFFPDLSAINHIVLMYADVDLQKACEHNSENARNPIRIHSYALLVNRSQLHNMLFLMLMHIMLSIIGKKFIKGKNTRYYSAI